MDLTLPQLRAALEKATEAYGAAISRDLAKAIDRLQHRLGWLDRCMHAGHGHRHAQSRALGKNSKSQAGPLSLFNWGQIPIKFKSLGDQAFLFSTTMRVLIMHTWPCLKSTTGMQKRIIC